jgi:hypothetical protein
MSACVRFSRDGLTYAGISRPPLDGWMRTAEGAATVDAVRPRLGFCLFGRTRAARRHLWKQLATAARDEAVVSAIQGELARYLPRLGDLAYCSGLPRLGVQLRRLVIVPCVLLNGDTYRSLERRLNQQPSFTALEGGRALREFFILQLIRGIEQAVGAARPSTKHPVAAGDGWLSVGMNTEFLWRLPMLEQPAWVGHHYMLEVTREPVTRAVKNEVGAAIEGLEASLPSLSRVERNEILRRARYVA